MTFVPYGFLQAIERLYPTSLFPYADGTTTSQWWAVNRAWGDMQMACNVRRAAGYMAHHGNDQVSEPPRHQPYSCMHTSSPPGEQTHTA